MAHSGNSDKLNTYVPHVGNAIAVMTSVITLGPIPAMMKSFVFMRPAALAIALGGVPTGKWNENEQQRAAGSIKYKGCILITTHWKEKKKVNTLAENSVSCKIIALFINLAF